MNQNVIKIIRHITYAIGFIFFLVGAIFSVVTPTELYANYLYLVCAIFFCIAHFIFDSIILFSELKGKKIDN